MKLINDLLALTVELAMLIGLGRVGFQFSQAAGYPPWTGLLLPVLVVITWGLWAAPKARRRLRIPWLTVLKMFLFTTSALLLWFSGYQTFALVLFATAVVQQFLEVKLSKQSG